MPCRSGGRELVRQGVPATDIVTLGRGEEDLLVRPRTGPRGPQPPGRNHDPAAASEHRSEPPRSPRHRPMPEPQSPIGSPSRSARCTATTSARATGRGAKTENELVGAELTFRALPGFLGGVSLKQMALWRLMPSTRSSPAARWPASTSPRTSGSSARLGAQRRRRLWRGRAGRVVAGPEIRFDIAPFGGFNFGLKAAYDYQFRNADWIRASSGPGWTSACGSERGGAAHAATVIWSPER